MFIVIFEVQPKSDRFEEYLGLAKQLKPKLEAMEGFIDNDRFKSRRDGAWLLSLSNWRDEKAVVRWRTHGEHHGVQEKGRFEVFEDYHLRVGEITSDTAPPSGMSVLQSRFDETVVGKAKAVTVTEFISDGPAGQLGLSADAKGLTGFELFDSIYTQGKAVLLASWSDAKAAAAWAPVKPPSVYSLRHRQVRVIRDYGMFERREAPQFYPDVRRR